MRQTDLIVLRAPTVYDCLAHPLLHPPVSENLSTKRDNSQTADLLAAIVELNKTGGRLGIINMAHTVAGKRFDIESFIDKLNTCVFALETDERERVPCSLETADSKTVLFGATARALNKELINFPQVDAILLTNLNDFSSGQLAEGASTGKLGKVPGMVWKEKRGKLRRNDLSDECDSKRLDISALYSGAFSHVLRLFSSGAIEALQGILSNPVVTIFSGNHPLQLPESIIQPHDNPKNSFRSPEDVYRDIVEISRYTSEPIRISGDMLVPDGHFAERLLSLLQHKPTINSLIFEFRSVVQPFFIREMARSAPHFRIRLTPGSHDEAVRQRAGRHYTNAELELTVSESLKAGTGGIELSFIAGLPGQTPQSIYDTTAYCETLLRLFDGDRRLSLSLSPFFPPADAGFGDLAGFGFKQCFSSFEEYLKAQTLPGWADRMEYCTPEMSTSELALTIYLSLSRLVRLKAKYGQIMAAEAERSATIYDRGMEMTRRIANFENNASDDEIALLEPEITSINRLSLNRTSRPGFPLLLSRPQNVLVAARALIENSPWHRKPVE
jgi:hypothetical protein